MLFSSGSILTRRLGHGLMALAALGLISPLASAQRGGPASVFVAPVEERDFAVRIESIGTLEPKERVDLSVNAADRVTGVYFGDGQRVSKGKTLLTLAEAEQAAVVEGAEATLEEALSEVERLRELVEDDVVTRQQFDEARRDADVARSQLKAVQAQYKNRVLVAPFAGVLGFRNVSVGAYVTPGDVVATLIDDSQMLVDFAVPSTFLAVLKPGLEVDAATHALPGEVFKGELVSVDNAIDPVTRSIRVRSLIENPERILKAGMYMSVTLKADPRPSIAVPEEAIQPIGPRSFVYVVEPSGEGPRARRREVALGMRETGYVEILAGVRPGERVVTEGIIRVREGALLNIQDKSLIMPEKTAPLVSRASSASAVSR